MREMSLRGYDCTRKREAESEKDREKAGEWKGTRALIKMVCAAPQNREEDPRSECIYFTNVTSEARRRLRALARFMLFRSTCPFFLLLLFFFVCAGHTNTCAATKIRRHRGKLIVPPIAGFSRAPAEWLAFFFFDSSPVKNKGSFPKSLPAQKDSCLKRVFRHQLANACLLTYFPAVNNLRSYRTFRQFPRPAKSHFLPGFKEYGASSFLEHHTSSIFISLQIIH
jgi:hypothetical protein